jgi:DNA primase
VKYRGREIDSVRLWEAYVDFPANLVIDGKYLPKVQCPNPNHDTTKRHFQINMGDGLVHCFAHCGISGTYEHALCIVHGLYDKYKVEEAADEREKSRRLQRARKDARKIILRSTAQLQKHSTRKAIRSDSGPATVVPDLGYETRIPPFGIEYLEGRGITSESIAHWRIGWDADEKRIVIPAHDANGHLRFLIKRAVREKDWPKYLYTEGFHKTSLLFGACKIDPGLIRSSGLILVEGSLGAIWLWQLGFRNVCAILGTGISRKQVEILARWRPRRIYLMFDKDSAGIANIEIASKRLRKYPLFVCRYPKLKDEPHGLTRREAHRAIERSLPISKLFQMYPNVRPKERNYIG